MGCCKERLIIELQSGEVRSFSMTIQTRVENTNTYTPMNLNGYTIEIDIKKYPYYSVESIIKKVLTIQEPGVTDSYIMPQTNSGGVNNIGKFVLGINSDDLEVLKPSGEYYIVITLVSGDNNRTIISAEGDKAGIIRFCNS